MYISNFINHSLHSSQPRSPSYLWLHSDINVKHVHTVLFHIFQCYLHNMNRTHLYLLHSKKQTNRPRESLSPQSLSVRATASAGQIHTHTHTHRTQSSIHPNHNSLLSNDSIILCASVNNPLSLSLSTGSWYQLQHSRSLLQSFQPVHATHSAIAYALSLSTRFTANIMLWEISPHTASHKVPSFPTRYHWQLSF